MPDRNCHNIPELCDANAYCTQNSNKYVCICNQGKSWESGKYFDLAMRRFSKISSFCHNYYRNSSSIANKGVASLPKKIIEALPIKSSPAKCKRPSIILGAFKFCNKVLIVGSLYYYTGKHGAWGTPEQSQHFIHTLCTGIKRLAPYYITAFFWPDDDE